MAKQETIKGAYLERLLFPKFPDPENRFFIGVFSQDGDWFGFGQEFTGKGTASEMEPGLTYTLTGKWEDNYYRGKKTKQFSFDMAVVEKPRDLGGIRIFLEKRLSGIGPKKSKAIVEAFGIDSIDILRDDPARVSKVLPILAGLAESISETLKKYEADDRILIELEKLFAGIKGLPRNLPQRCLDEWAADAVKEITGNPYQLTKFKGIGFLLADQVAMHSIKLDPDSIERKRAAVVHCLREYQQSTGNTWIHMDVLESNADALIGCKSRPGLLDLINHATLAGGAGHKDVGEFVTFLGDYENEWAVADKLKNLLQIESGMGGVCPKCGNKDLWQEEADVGIGIIYGPYCCPCGWSEDEYDDGLVMCLNCNGKGCESCGFCGRVDIEEGDF